jgi:hypothetical protein
MSLIFRVCQNILTIREKMMKRRLSEEQLAKINRQVLDYVLLSNGCGKPAEDRELADLCLEKMKKTHGFYIARKKGLWWVDLEYKGGHRDFDEARSYQNGTAAFESRELAVCVACLIALGHWPDIEDRTMETLV